MALVCPWSSAVVRPKGCQIREDGGLNRPAPRRGTVLDPFMGSASTGVAAVAEGLTFLGSEAQPPYFDLAQARMRQAIRESRMSSVRAA